MNLNLTHEIFVNNMPFCTDFVSLSVGVVSAGVAIGLIIYHGLEFLVDLFCWTVRLIVDHAKRRRRRKG